MIARPPGEGFDFRAPPGWAAAHIRRRPAGPAPVLGASAQANAGVSFDSPDALEFNGFVVISIGFGKTRAMQEKRQMEAPSSYPFRVLPRNGSLDHVLGEPVRYQVPGRARREPAALDDACGTLRLGLEGLDGRLDLGCRHASLLEIVANQGVAVASRCERASAGAGEVLVVDESGPSKGLERAGAVCRRDAAGVESGGQLSRGSIADAQRTDCGTERSQPSKLSAKGSRSCSIERDPGCKTDAHRSLDR